MDIAYGFKCPSCKKGDEDLFMTGDEKIPFACASCIGKLGLDKGEPFGVVGAAALRDVLSSRSSLGEKVAKLKTRDK